MRFRRYAAKLFVGGDVDLQATGQVDGVITEVVEERYDQAQATSHVVDPRSKQLFSFDAWGSFLDFPDRPHRIGVPDEDDRR